MADQSGEFDYDLLVIGGGSGGLAASKEAASFGAKVAVCDFVKPSPAGTTWGLGGTCVNVGCIPKKLFHLSASVSETRADAGGLGWEISANHKWEKMVENVNGYIRSLNWNYKTTLKSSNVDYINAYAEFKDAHTVELTDKKGGVTYKTARYFFVATGGRPSYGGYPGAEECCISSDDIFWKTSPPGKTLVVGASYIALECAGFISGLGYPTTVMVRSILLRGFDQDMANAIGSYMERHSVHFAKQMVPTRFEKAGEQVRVFAKDSSGEEAQFGLFDTVLMAVGRTGEAGKINLEAAGVQYDTKTGKIPVNDEEQTNVEHIYAIGDVCVGRQELTPVAIQAGRLVAARVFGGKNKLMDYSNVPTTVFTPLEYGAVGLSEDEARSKLGENAKVYHSFYKPLLWNTNSERKDNDCYVKVICDSSARNKVVGIHILGLHAGEIVQGFGVAVKAGVTKEVLDDTVGIHPTDAEIVTTLVDVKTAGKALKAKGGC